MSDALERVSQLARMMELQAEAIKAMEEGLRTAKENYRRIEQEDLPELMAEVGLMEMTLVSGAKVQIKPDVETSVSQERMPAVVAWLTDRNYDGIVKTELSIPFGRGELEIALKTATELQAQLGKEVDVTQKIHPQTLKSFVKERMAHGEAIPFDMFAIRSFNVAKITPAKAPKAKR